MKLMNSIKINCEIEVLSGLHIGAGKEALEIGGLDNAVIKNPRTLAPYIPGSSIKGKMRFLSEWKHDKVLNENAHACSNAGCCICRTFGTMEKTDGKRGTTRLVVRDANLIGLFTPETMLEVKYSTAIDRMTGTAKQGSLRNLERVVPGVKFSFEIVYRVFDLDDDGKADMENFKIVVEALKLLENDTLGGSGSRGCGQIAFRNIKVTGGANAGDYQSIDDLLKKYN
jgi:CRISPR-associated protein Csm3